MTQIELQRPLAPVTVDVPYAPTEKTQIDLQVPKQFSPVALDITLRRPPPEHQTTELEMNIERPPMTFQPITVEFPHPDATGQPPVFVQRLPESVQIEESVPARMIAQMAGNPQPSVNWLKNGQPLVPSDRVFTSVEVSVF